MIAGVVSYMLLCYSSELFVLDGGVGLPPGVCYVCVCVGLAHLVFYGRENRCVKCRNG